MGVVIVNHEGLVDFLHYYGNNDLIYLLKLSYNITIPMNAFLFQLPRYLLHLLNFEKNVTF